MITVTLSQDEVRERSQALAQYANKMIELEEEEEDVKAAYKSKMARLKERRLEISGELRRLSRAVRLGVEERTTQRVLFDEEKRLEEFKQEARRQAGERIAEGEELIEQQQQAEQKEVKIHYSDKDPMEKCVCGDYRDEHTKSGGCMIAACDCAEFRPAKVEKEGEGFQPGFPPGFDPDRASAGLAQVDEEAGDYQAEWFAALTTEEREKYHAAPCSCGHSRDWHGEEDKDICERGCGVCKCGQYHCPVCDTKRGHQATCEHYVLGEGTPVQKADNFTASRCASCGRIDGAHTPECVWSDALRFDDYLAYARAHYKSNHQSHARKMELSKLSDDKVREWKQQAGNGVEAEPEPKKTKPAKLTPVEAAIDR